MVDVKVTYSPASYPCCSLFSGMVDIARQTVEFLYEENGGIPRDLYLPTIEDIKDEANKFTIDKVRKGFCFPPYFSCETFCEMRHCVFPIMTMSEAAAGSPGSFSLL